MIQKGLVSIITPTYNCGAFIGETIKSVLSQTYEDWEMIIVDDCSTDDTENIVKEYTEKDDRVRYYKLKKNSGPAVARNEAMHHAKGEYMAFLDSDDLWMPDKLVRQIRWMELNGYPFSNTSYEQIDERGQSLGRVAKSIGKTGYSRLLLDCPVGNSTVMYNVEKMGYFEVPDIRKRNDDALWLKMLKKEKYMYGMPDVLMKYRIRGNSVSSNKFKLVKYHWILYRNIEHLSVWRSLFHIGYWGIIKVLRIK